LTGLLFAGLDEVAVVEVVASLSEMVVGGSELEMAGMELALEASDPRPWARGGVAEAVALEPFPASLL
jgi:hypothetical protein